MIGSQQLPKKIAIQKFRIKNRTTDKSKHHTSLQNHKQLLQVSFDIGNKKQIQNKFKINPNNIKNKSSDRTLRYIPQAKSFQNKKTVEKLPKQRKSVQFQGIQVSCQTQANEKNKTLGNEVAVGLKNKTKTDLEDYEQEFLLKWKAKEFVTKLKKDKQEAQRKLDIMRLQANQKKRAKLLQLEEKARIQHENQLNKRREQARHKLQEIKFKEERRKEQLLFRDLHQKKLSKSNRSSDLINNEVQQKINELNAILHRRAKTRVEVQDIKTKELSPVNRVASSQLNVKQNKKPNRNQMRSVKSRNIGSIKKINKLQQHLYLSIDDEKMLEDIKVKLDKLQTLRSESISTSYKKKKSLLH